MNTGTPKSLKPSWLIASPGHQRPWYWLGGIGSFLSCMSEEFKRLCPLCRNDINCRNMFMFLMENLERKGKGLKFNSRLKIKLVVLSEHCENYKHRFTLSGCNRGDNLQSTGNPIKIVPKPTKSCYHWSSCWNIAGKPTYNRLRLNGRDSKIQLINVFGIYHA